MAFRCFDPRVPLVHVAPWSVEWRTSPSSPTTTSDAFAPARIARRVDEYHTVVADNHLGRHERIFAIAARVFKRITDLVDALIQHQDATNCFVCTATSLPLPE
jgi:hypothetical protein